MVIPSVTRPPTTARYFEWALVVVAILAGAIFTVADIQHPVWLDEANSILTASRSFTGIVDSLSRDNNLPAYYFLLALWIRIFGDSEIAVRMLSAIFYLVGCGAVFLFARQLAHDSRTGWYGALFYGCSPLSIRHAQNIRMYSLVGALAGLSMWAFLRVFRDRDGSRGAIVAFVAINAIGLLSHYWFVFVLAGELITLIVLFRQGLSRFLLLCATAALPFAVLWGRLAMAQLDDKATAWMPRVWPMLVLREFLDFYGPIPAIPLYILAASTLALVLLRRTGVVEKVRIAALLFAVIFTVPFVISAVKPIFWPGRYMIIAVVPLAATLAVLFVSALPRTAVALLGLALLLFQAGYHLRRGDSVEGQSADVNPERMTARFILDRAKAGDAIVFTSMTRAAAEYYFRRAHAEGRFVEVSFPAEVASHLGWSDPIVRTSERREQLEMEAATTVQRLTEIAGRGGKVWMYDGATAVNRILRERLDRMLRIDREYPIGGPYHTRIIEYGVRN